VSPDEPTTGAASVDYDTSDPIFVLVASWHLAVRV